MLCKIIQRAEQLLPKEKTLYHRLCLFLHVLLSRTSCRITCLCHVLLEHTLLPTIFPTQEKLSWACLNKEQERDWRSEGLCNIGVIVDWGGGVCKNQIPNPRACCFWSNKEWTPNTSIVVLMSTGLSHSNSPNILFTCCREETHYSASAGQWAQLYKTVKYSVNYWSVGSTVK